MVYTEQGLTGGNMFAYCGNNPVNRVDPTGRFFNSIWDWFTELADDLSGIYATLAAATVVDGPLPLVDAIALGCAAFATIGAIGYNAITSSDSHAKPKAKEKAEAIVIPSKPDSPVVFPVNPNAFNPAGLSKVYRSGTKNGAIISWMDPLTNTEVFRWDENPNYPNGPHYHINDPIYNKTKVHFYPGDKVPEPYATIYFPFG